MDGSPDNDRSHPETESYHEKMKILYQLLRCTWTSSHVPARAVVARPRL